MGILICYIMNVNNVLKFPTAMYNWTNQTHQKQKPSLIDSIFVVIKYINNKQEEKWTLQEIHKKPKQILVL